MRNVMQAGSRVHVSGYSPFRGLSGTIQLVDVVTEIDELLCFYLIKLESTPIQEAVWFPYDEIESISTQELEFLGTPGADL